MALSVQGVVSWILALRAGELKYHAHQSHAHLAPFHQILIKKFRNVQFWSKLAKKAALIYPILLAVHVFVSWAAFPAFGRVISAVFPVAHPIRHSWFVLFRFSLLFHAFGVSFLLCLLNKLAALCIDYFLSAPKLHASTLVPKSEHCLAVGVSQSRHPFIHLSAIHELQSLLTGSDSARRRKLFAAVEEEGSLSREICDWFVAEMSKLVQHAQMDLKELRLLQDELAHVPASTEQQQQILVKNLWIEKISKRFFASTAASAEVTITPSTAQIPEIFAKRGAEAASAPTQLAPVKPLILDFAPLLNKHVLGKRLLAYWIGTRKTHCIARFACLVSAIDAIGKFVSCSFEEDVTGQVQMVLPRLIESMISAFTALNDLAQVKLGVFVPVEQEADAHLTSIKNSIAEALRLIKNTFGSTMEDVRISNQCRSLLEKMI